VLLPHLAGVVVERIARVDGVIEIGARARGSTATCPGCGAPSDRVHSRYERSLADAAIGGQSVRIRLQVRRFACARTACARRTFVEQVDDLTIRYGRHSQLLRRMLEAIGLALSGRAGARLADRLSIPVNRMTLLRLIRALPDRVPSEIVAVGVDDFAFRRGHVYGTVLIDITTHRPVDVLPDRTADTVAAWLKQRAGVRIVCRDRAGAYAEAARVGAPDAVQVADRWHLWHNLAQAVEKVVAAHRADLHADDDADPVDAGASPSQQPVPLFDCVASEAGLVTRSRERHAAVQQLRQQGVSLTAIAQQLGLSRKTVRRFARTDDVEELLVKARGRNSLLDPFKAYLHERFRAGHTDAALLKNEIAALGYRGSARTVRRYLQAFRGTGTAPPPKPVAPSVRQVTGWLTRRPTSLSEDERLELKKTLDRSDALSMTYQHTRQFAEMLTKRRGDRLPGWISDVEADGPAALRSFATGLRGDLAAVTAGLTLPYSSGAVEGTVNRIKMIKRQMFGRARFDLLRKRILNPA